MTRQRIKDRPDRKNIDHDLITAKLSLNQIARKYDVNVAALHRYRKKYLSAKINKHLSRKDYREGEALYNLLSEYIENVNIVARSCLRALRDPEDPEFIDVGVQAKDVKITYIDAEGKRNKVNLQHLLDDLNGVERVEINGPDRVLTLLKASEAMNKHLTLLADMRGMIGNTVVNLVNQPLFRRFSGTVLEIISEFPEAKAKLLDEMVKMRLVSPDEATAETPSKRNESAKNAISPPAGYKSPDQPKTPKIAPKSDKTDN